jgi:hypothetical protein
VTLVLLLVTASFIGLGIIGRQWPISLLIIVAFAIAFVLTNILWRVIDNKNIKKNNLISSLRVNK